MKKVGPANRGQCVVYGVVAVLVFLHITPELATSSRCRSNDWTQIINEVYLAPQDLRQFSLKRLVLRRLLFGISWETNLESCNADIHDPPKSFCHWGNPEAGWTLCK